MLRRILARAKREWSLVADGPLRRRLQARSRLPRGTVALNELPSRSVLLVVAHPDDEVISAGGLLGRFPRAGVICLTNGAPYRGSFTKNAGFDNWMDYARTRDGEAKAALALLGRDVPSYNLGIPDQGSVDHLVAAARHLLPRLKSGFDCVLTHAYEGGHTDHDSAAFTVHAACALIAKAGGVPPLIVVAPLYNFPDGKLVWSKFLPNDDAGPVSVFPLSAAEQDRKRRMFECHRTQKEIFTNVGLQTELFRQAPRYHFSAPPHVDEVGFWNWGRCAWLAMRELGLCEELA
ncbi:MAG: PIG-L family deacetylase [Myxococcales bacterium]|nr:PIG-L family deacetylase [Myxococcales bacterium]